MPDKTLTDFGVATHAPEFKLPEGIIPVEGISGDIFEIDYNDLFAEAELEAIVTDSSTMVGVAKRIDSRWPNEGMKILELRRFDWVDSVTRQKLKWDSGVLIPSLTIKRPYSKTYWVVLLLLPLLVFFLMKNKTHIVIFATLLLLFASAIIAWKYCSVGAVPTLFVLYFLGWLSAVHLGAAFHRDPAFRSQKNPGSV